MIHVRFSTDRLFCLLAINSQWSHTLQSIEALKRTETLDAKEKALQAKEAELRRWEADLRATGGLKPKKNWPNRFCPIVHHDIAAEVNNSTNNRTNLLLLLVVQYTIAQ